MAQDDFTSYSARTSHPLPSQPNRARTVNEADIAGNVVWADGDYTLTDTSGMTIRGKFTGVLVRDGDEWHIAQLMAMPSK